MCPYIRQQDNVDYCHLNSMSAKLCKVLFLISGGASMEGGGSVSGNGGKFGGISGGHLGGGGCISGGNIGGTPGSTSGGNLGGSMPGENMGGRGRMEGGGTIEGGGHVSGGINMGETAGSTSGGATSGGTFGGMSSGHLGGGGCISGGNTAAGGSVNGGGSTGSGGSVSGESMGSMSGEAGASGGGMFVIRHKASGLCLYPKGSQRRKIVGLVLDKKCNDPKAVFQWSSKFSIESVAFSGYYMFVKRRRLVLRKSSLKGSRVFQFDGQKMAFSYSGRYIRPVKRRRKVAAGARVIASKMKFKSWMMFEMLGKE